MIPQPDSNGLRGRLRTRESAARHSHWGIGGPVARFYEPADRADLERFLYLLPNTEAIAWTGLGCSLLVRDGGYAGTLIAARRAFDGLTALPDGRLRVGAGVRLPKLARFCAQQGITGAEQFANWPNTVGGALQQSITHDGASLWPLVIEIQLLDRHGAEYQVDMQALRGRGISRDEWLTGVVLDFTAIAPGAAQASAPPPGASGPLFRATAARSVRELLRQAGVHRVSHGGVQQNELDGNYVHVRHNARVSDLESLMVQVQDTVRSRLGIRLERQVQLIGVRT